MLNLPTTPITPLLAFAAAAAILTITPGLDTALVLRTAAVEGQRRAALAGAGICSGLMIWGAAVAAGLGAVLAASATAYSALRWIGAAYLLYLGGGMLLRPRSGLVMQERQPAAPAAGRRSWYVRGMLTNVLNPKVGVFYVTFLPQFIPAHVNVPALVAAMVAIHAVEGMLWFALLISATRTLSRWIQRPAVVRRLDRVTGVVLVAFGVRLAAHS